MSLIPTGNHSVPTTAQNSSWDALTAARDAIFTDKKSDLTKLALFFLGIGVAYLLVQGGRRLYTYCTKPLSTHEKEVATLGTAISLDSLEENKIAPFFRITGKSIAPDTSVLLLGTDDDYTYPEHVVQLIKNCKVLVTYVPPSQAPAESLRDFVRLKLTLTLMKLKDEAWVRSQLMIVGYTGVQLEEQIDLVRNLRQPVLDVTLDSWRDNLSPENIKFIENLFKDTDPLNKHPLIIMHLLGNELDILYPNYSRIESELANFFKDNSDRNRLIIQLDDTDIVSADITDIFIDSLCDFHTDPSFCAENIQRFCKRLEFGYSNDEESKNDRLQQPQFFYDSFSEVLSKGPNPEIITVSSTIQAKTLAWQSTILEALQQNQSTAIVIPEDTLNLHKGSGMIDFLKSQGYSVEAVR